MEIGILILVIVIAILIVGAIVWALKFLTKVTISVTKAGFHLFMKIFKIVVITTISVLAVIMIGWLITDIIMNNYGDTIVLTDGFGHNFLVWWYDFCQRMNDLVGINDGIVFPA